MQKLRKAIENRRRDKVATISEVESKAIIALKMLDFHRDINPHCTLAKVSFLSIHNWLILNKFKKIRLKRI